MLVVDDDDEIRELIRDYLTGMGFRTRAAANGREMWHQMDDSVDLVILDLMLPGEDGLSLCRDLRHQGSVPVIMISARGACAERIIGLEIGADDYLCKPFDPRELLARIRAVLRRRPPTREHRAPEPDTADEARERCFAGWRLDLQTRRLHSPGNRVLDLPRSDFMVLKALSEVPNRIVSRNTLSQRAFGREYYPDDRSIDVCISRLRQMLEDDARRPRFIRTIRNEGYLLELPDAVE
ncbi:DNA-binding response regulator [Kushneria pakistanensis]|uniref:DNA-binding response regulator n=1 Tax=Kushneria pakistanensis TaxID=1508770 RepID=A0ABQ3FA83_9GAMM|nr:DNA-binding response regulator [Kushneria pakistanensis]